MTITIGAICDKGETILLLADRQVSQSNGMPTGESLKGFKLSDYSMILTSGEKNNCIFILNAFQEINSKEFTIKQQADILWKYHNAYRREKMTQIILSKYGFLSIDEFYEKHKFLDSSLLIPLQKEMENFSIGVELILGGRDIEGSHLYYIYQFGVTNVDYPGCCVAPINNAGLANTIFSIASFSREDQTNVVMGLSYAAKKWSEKNPGVGSKTDAWVINKDGLSSLDEKTLKNLDANYSTFISKIPNIKEIMKIDKKMIFYNKDNISSIAQT